MLFLIVESLCIVLLVMILLMVYRHDGVLSKRNMPTARIEEYWNGKERRRHLRFKKVLEVNYTVEKKPHLKNGKTVDISEGGVKLLLDEKLREGVILALKIALPNSKMMAEIEGDVVWSSEAQDKDPSGKRLFHSGIRFFAMREPSGTNLVDYIRSLSEESAD